MSNRSSSPDQSGPSLELKRDLARQAEIDALVRPIIEDRLAAFRPVALASAKGQPTEVHDTRSVPAPEQDRRDRRTEHANRQRLIRQLLYRSLARIVELVPGVTGPR